VKGWVWLVCLLLAAGLACAPGPGSRAPRVLVLGFDGMDPQLLQRFLDQGALPHFRQLIQEGGDFKTLGTTNPPQSPVAWSTFITGLDPAEHGVLDFVHRDPQTLTALPSLNAVEEGEYQLLREGTPFWRHLEEAGVPARLVKIPASFPALEPSGTYLTDMGTPDLEGTYGTYSFYTDATTTAPPGPQQGGRRVQVEVRDNQVLASLVGPDRSSLSFQVAIDRPAGAALVEISGQQQTLLKPGEWSDWIPVDFPRRDSSWRVVRGMVRVYLQSLEPFALYVSPPNIDPLDPVISISQPHRYASLLAQECGRFYTQGMPEETAALLDGLFTDQDFLRQNQLVIDERRRLLEHELARFESGLLFFYVSSTDILSHLYWNTIDPDHPGYDQERAKKYGHVILGSYQLADDFLGEAMAAVDRETTIVVLSDHGFAPYRRSVQLNQWLREHDYQTASGPSLADIDWADTEAYAVGFNGLYLNLQGREAQGQVPLERRQALLEKLRSQLELWRDPDSGQKMIASLEVLPLPEDPALRALTPDLLVGYARGYRASWETALGGVGSDPGSSLVSDNTQAWSGDHLIAPQLVPGVLLSNRPIRRSNPALRDLAPSLLELYRVPPDRGWSGTSIW
jgi:predicted AlkP superfamily phosphohydrolase/phosphomutase